MLLFHYTTFTHGFTSVCISGRPCTMSFCLRSFKPWKFKWQYLLCQSHESSTISFLMHYNKISKGSFFLSSLLQNDLIWLDFIINLAIIISKHKRITIFHELTNTKQIFFQVRNIKNIMNLLTASFHVDRNSTFTFRIN